MFRNDCINTFYYKPSPTEILACLQFIVFSIDENADLNIPHYKLSKECAVNADVQREYSTQILV